VKWKKRGFHPCGCMGGGRKAGFKMPRKRGAVAADPVTEVPEATRAEQAPTQEAPAQVKKPPEPPAIRAPAARAAQEQPKPAENAASKQPAKMFRAGRLWCGIWENHHEERGPWYSISLTRRYQDAEGTWRNSDRLGLEDLLPAGQLTQVAWHWINERLQAQSREENAR
jgi:hypothetical protein